MTAGTQTEGRTLAECLSEPRKRHVRIVAYSATFLSTFSLGITEIFASWYAGKLGATPFEMGLAMGSFGIVYMFSPAIGGKISDRIGRKKSLMIATGAYICLLLLYPQPFIIPLHLILIRALEGLFFGLFNPTVEAMVAELCPGSQAAVLGNFSTSWSAGMIMSPFVLAYMATNFGSVTSIYVALAIEIVTLGLIGFAVKDYRLTKTTPVTAAKSESRLDSGPDSGNIGGHRSLRTSTRFVASYLSLALFGFVSTVILSLFPTYIQGLPGYGPQTFGNLLVVWNVTRTLAFLACSKFPHKWMGRAIIAGTVFITASMFPISFLTDLTSLMIAMVLCGIGAGFSYLGALYIVVSASDEEKGAHAGIVESLAGVGFFAGPMAGGWVAGFGFTLPYRLSLIYGIITVILVAAALRASRRQ